MATYQELFAIANDTPQPLAEKVRIGILVKAQAIAVDGGATAPQKAWAVSALRNPAGDFQAVLNYLLATNKGAAVATITDAVDATVQTAVDAAVTQLLGA